MSHENIFTSPLVITFPTVPIVAVSHAIMGVVFEYNHVAISVFATMLVNNDEFVLKIISCRVSSAIITSDILYPAVVFEPLLDQVSQSIFIPVGKVGDVS